MRHDISTTIVEIDPAVYKAARTFFGLPDPGADKVFLEDARTWVAKQRATIDKGDNTTRFDIVVHDCFSGGGVPQHIFTTEFWVDLKTVMEPEGILVVVSKHNHLTNSHGFFQITFDV
jgi:spermidine synthase